MAITISSIMIASAVGVFASAEKSIYREKVGTGIVELGEKIKKGFATRSDYVGISESAVRNLGLLPDILVSGGPDGADLSISPGPDGSFDIAIDFAGTVSARGWCVDLLPDPSHTWIATGAGVSAGEGMQSGMTLEGAVDICDGSTVFTFRGM